MKKGKLILRWLGGLAAAGLVALLLLLPRLAGAEGPRASVLSARASLGEIRGGVSGGGQLTEPEALAVTVPSKVLVTEYLVKNGDLAKEGLPLFRVDRVSVMSSVLEVQEALEALDKEIQQVAEQDGTLRLDAAAAGRVKAVYAEEGEDARAVMLRSGALLELSLDGLMAVDFPTAERLRVGDRVTVTGQDRTYPGRVESCFMGAATVTLSDDGPPLGERVTVADGEGTLLGEGSLRVHSPWRLMATEGRVRRVQVREGELVYGGQRLLTLSEAGGAGRILELGEKRREYEALLRELLTLYRDGVVCAPREGLVSGVDESLLAELARAEPGFVPLANAPGPEPEGSFRNRVGMVTALNGDGTLTVRLQPVDLPVEDYLRPTGVVTLPATMTEEGKIRPAPAYILTENGWQSLTVLNPGDVFLFAYRETELAFMIYMGHNEPSENGDFPQPGDLDLGDLGGLLPGGGGAAAPSMEDILAQYAGISGYAGFDFSSLLPKQEEDGLYSLEGRTLLSLTPAEGLELCIRVDELDVLRVAPGMEATVAVEALPGERFAARVTRVSAVGENQGGSSKFDVTLALDRAPRMLGGMSATALLDTGGSGPVLTLPVAALNDRGSESFVYTAYDQKHDLLLVPVTVTTGASDGRTVEITGGLNEGDLIWYQSYETPADAPLGG